MLNKEICKVYMPGTNRLLPTGPGRSLKFLGGVASIRDERDMPWVFGLNAQVEMQAEYLEWLPKWVERYNDRNPAKATIVLLGPLATRINIGPPPDYRLSAIAEPTPAGRGGKRAEE